MRNVTVINNLTLDGVMQAPARPDEDTRDGFQYGGWATAYDDADKHRIMAEGRSRPTELLLGRRTYEDFFKVWPSRKDNPYTQVLNDTQKYVASRTHRGPLPWQNSTLLPGDAADAVARLKQDDGADLLVLGSGELVRSLLQRDLVDGFRLLIHPLVLGSGHRMFGEPGALAKFRLERSDCTSKGVIIATYFRN